MNPLGMMTIGGLDSFQVIEPSLNASSAEVIDDAFEQAWLV